MNNLTIETEQDLADCFQAFRPKLKEQLRSFNVQDPDVLDDILQDTFTKGLICFRKKTLQVNHPGNSAEDWFARTAKNLFIDSTRRQKKRPVFVSMANLQLEDELHDEQKNMEEIFSHNEMVRSVRLAIGMLDLKQQEVIVGRYFQEIKFREISVLSGDCLYTTIARHRYALIKLKKTNVITPP